MHPLTAESWPIATFAAVAQRRSVSGRTGHRRRFMSTRPSTTLADLLIPPLAAYPFSAVWTSPWRWSSQERENGVTDGGQSWLGRWAADSFFSALRLRGGDTGGRRTRSSS